MNESEDQASQTVQKLLLLVARNAIRSGLGLETVSIPPNDEAHPILKQKRGVFVTLKKSGSLRGCIGYPLPYKELLEAVVDNARAAAFQDPRFPAVNARELDQIKIEISLLTVPRTVNSPEDVLIGRDGIIISSGFNRGLLLPQVPIEQNWNREQYLDYGCLKASLPSGYWRNNPVTIETFQAQVFGEKEESRGTI